jgi:iron-sulfur cluster assembly accessory protein
MALIGLLHREGLIDCMANTKLETPKVETGESQEVAALTVTPLAAQTVKRLLEEKQLAGHGLRVFVAGGGCSGLQYGMAFENNPQPLDKVFEVEGIRIIVDPTSMQFLSGATIDYVDNLMGGGFRIDNPNALATCGCGQSFRTAGGSQEPGQAHGGGCSGC